MSTTTKFICVTEVQLSINDILNIIFEHEQADNSKVDFDSIAFLCDKDSQGNLYLKGCTYKALIAMEKTAKGKGNEQR